MATISRSRRDDDERSAGGKIVRRRRERLTPYARPIPPAVESADVDRNLGNPNYWLSGLMLPAKMIATGAGKIFSTVFGAEAESESSYSDDEDSVCESDDKEEDVVVSHHDQPDEMAPSSIGNSENKHLIMQLVGQEYFSSEEGEELIRLIKSRIVSDGGSMRNIESNPDTRTAIVEAKKWLEKKKSGSELKPVMDQYFPSDQATFLEDDIGSPVDVAKSYMQSRTAWSPSAKQIEISTPSTTHSSKEEKFKSIYPNSVQLSEARRNSLLSGSWNILEEIRRVRSKATEELLATTPSKKDVPLTLPKENSNEGEPSTENRDEVATGYELRSSASAALNSENKQVEPDGLHSEALATNGNSTAYNQYEDDEAVRAAGGARAGADPDANSKQLDEQALPQETDGSRDYAAQNGFPSGASSFSLGEDQNNQDSHNRELADAMRSAQLNLSPSGNTQLQEPASPKSPVANQNTSTVSVSQNSSSLQNEENTRSKTGRSTPKRKAAVVAELKGAAQVKPKPRKLRVKRKVEER